MAKRKKVDPIDQEIERQWYAQASGVQVPIMDIPKIFADCRKAHTEGVSIEDAVKAAAAKYRVN